MRTLLAAFVLLLAAAGAWWFLGDGDGPVAPLPSASSDAETSPAPVPRESTPPPEAPGTRDAIESPPAPAGYVFRIKVVRDEDEAPVPDAELRYLPEGYEIDIPVGRRSLLMSDRERFHAEFGVAQRADAQGIATITNDDRALSVSAREGDRFASQRFTLERPARSGSFELRLTRDEPFELRTLDESNAPIEGIVVRCRSESSGREMSFGPSDRDGRIVIRRANDLRSNFGGTTTCALFAEIHDGDGDPTTVSLAPLPADPIVVRVPPCAAFDVHCLGPDGEPWLTVPREDALIFLRPVEPGARWHGRSAVSLGSTGTLRLWPVRCGAKLGLSWIVMRESEQIAQAPEEPGESLRVEFRMPASAAWLTGRVLNEDRSPRSGRYYVELESGTASTASLVGAREDGRFRAVLGQVPLVVPARIRVIEFPVLTKTARVAVAFEWSRPLVPGANDLGDIVLLPTPVLATMRVEWIDGEPADGAGVGVASFSKHGWRSDPVLRAEQRDDGSFVVRGLRDERRLLVTARHPQAAARVEQELAPGEEDVVLRLARGGELTARFVVDADVPWRKLAIALHDEAPPAGRFAPPGPRADNKLDGDHLTARWIGLRPGRYRLEVAEGPSPQAFVSIAGIEVPPGQSTDDPRLRDIDLRGLVHRIRVVVTDESGAPMLGRLVHVLRRGGLEWSGHETKDGQVELISRFPVDLSITAEDYRTHELLGVARDATVRLEPAPRYVVRLDATLPAATTLRVQLVPVDLATYQNTRFRTESSSGDLPTVLGITPCFASFDAPSELEWRPRVDGVWRVVASVVRKRTQPIELAERQTIDTRLLPSGSILTIRPDPKALAAAIAKLPD